MLRFRFTLYAILFSGCILSAQIGGFRIGAGVGYSLYTGNQMDGTISTSTHGKSELNKGYNLQVYKSINDKYEIGFRYLSTNLWSFKSKDDLGLSADIEEYSINIQRSLNDNISLTDGRFTFNIVAGIGLCRFKSAFYDFTTTNGFNIPFSSVGYGNNPTLSGVSIADKLIEPLLIGGINIGFRVNNVFTIYFENTFSTTNSNKISGNLYRKNSIPPDGFTYHAITLYINFFDYNKSKRMRCPKF